MFIRLIICFLMMCRLSIGISQTISLVDNQTSTSLANTLAGKGIQVTGGFTLNCSTLANGTFVNVNPTPNLSLAIDSGIVLCTGRVLSTTADTGINANRFRLASNNLGITTSDAQIATLAGASAVQRDLCFLQFNFVPRGDSAFIDYVFASEDYPEYVCLSSFDAFGIFVQAPSDTFKNYSKVPGTNINVSVNSINDTSKQTGVSNFNTYCKGLGAGSPFIQFYTANLINNHIVYDGMTKVLRARIPVQPNLTHTMKLAIADILDGNFDSGIFFKKSSFTSPPLLEITDKKATNGSNKDSLFLVEGCNPGVVSFSRSTISSPITVNVNFSGTANAADYSASSSFTIAAGNNSFNYNVSALTDAIKENIESLRIIFSVPSINYADTVQYYIKDFANGVTINNGKRDTSLCVGQNITLRHTATDTSFKTVWTPASNLSCTNCSNTIYTYSSPNTSSVQNVFLRISSVGCPTADSLITINVNPKPVISLPSSYSICINDSVRLNASISPVGAYSYTWTPNLGLSASNILDPFAKPTATQAYKLVVASPFGCRDSANTTVNISTIRGEIDSMRTTNTTCGTSNGSIRLFTKTSAPNNPPYTYSINGGTSFGSSNIFNGLAAGVYNVAIRNGSNCRFDTTLTITAGSNPPSATFTITNTSCGLVNGSARIITKSGVAPLAQQWRLGASIISTDTFINNRPAGNYVLTIVDNVGCSVNYPIAILGSSPANFSFIKTDQTCGNSNGSITANATSGASPFTYTWNQGGSTPTILGLTGGWYKLTFSDVNGCTKIDSVQLLSFPAITQNKSGTNALCGASNGTATAIVTSGGTSPFIYSWSNGVTTSPISASNHTINSLSGGKYKFTIQDSKGCTAFDSVIVNSSPALNISISRTNATCGNNNGSISVNILTGTPTYTYVWNDAVTTQNRINLGAGSYSVTATDGNGCTASGAAVVTMGSAPSLSTTKTNATCGLNNGSISTNVSGAKPPIVYNWSNGQTSNFISGLAPGIYSVTITDSFGCQRTKADTIHQPPFTNFTDSIVQTTCNTNNGQLFIKNIVGQSPISIVWSDGNTTATRTGLSPGNYSVLVQDGNGCQKSKTFTILASSNPSINFSINQALCNNTTGSISSSISGGTPAFSYTWSSGETTPNITAKAVGSYTLTVTDFNNCSATKTDSIIRRPPPTYQDSFRKARCGFNNGLIHIYNLVGSSPYSFSWSHDPNASGNFVVGLPSDTISVAITDSNGCIVRDTWDLTTKGAITYQTSIQRSKCNDSTGKITINITNGTPPYTIQWSNGDTGVMADSLKFGRYELLITDSLGCIVRDSITMRDSTMLRDTFVIVKTRCDTASGTILAMPFGGKAPYKHVWQRLPRDTFALLDSVTIGTYRVLTTDSNGCKYDTTTTMLYTHYPTITDSIVLEKCGGSNGEIHIKIDSVINPITIRWNGIIDSTYKKIGLKGPLTFSIQVIDSHKCQAFAFPFIDTNPIVPPIIVSSDPPCGNNLGTISLSFSPPIVAQSYIWSNSKTTASIDSLAPGIYSVTMTDTAGCVYVLRDTLAYTTAPTKSISWTRSNCGRFDGQIITVANSIYGDYFYSWKKMSGAFAPNEQATDTGFINNVDSGVYVVRISDTKGCILFDTIAIIDSTAPKIQFQIKNSHCNNGNGKAKAVVTGGSPPYSYTWYNFTTLDSLSSLFSGNYLLTVSDNRACVTIDTAKVLFIQSPDINLIPTNSFCGPSNGRIVTNISFGQSPFSFSWSHGPTTKDLNGLAANKYILTITDSTGCTDKDSVNIAAQPPLAISISKKPANCDLNNGILTASVVTGKPPYIFHWNTIISSMTASGLDTGKHVFYISDSNNCEIRDTVHLSRVKKHSASHIVVNDNCTYKIGSISTNVIDGRLPYTYSWSGGLGTNANAINVGAGTYTLSITDSLGCLVTSLVNVGDTAGPIVSLIVNTASCGLNNGSIFANVISSRTPLSHFWNNVAGTNTLSNINGGKFVYRVIDSRGCIKQDSATLDTVFPLTATKTSKNPSCNLNNGYIKIRATGGTGAKSYFWSPAAPNTDSIANLSPGKYKYTVTDTRGCIWIDSVTLIQQGLPTINFNKTPSTCRAGNGSLQAVVTNASGTITYNWSNGGNTPTISGIVPNNYSVTVTDATGCSASSTTFLNSIGVDSINLIFQHPKCNLNNGKIKAVPNNTIGTVNYNWSTTATIDSIINLGANTYTVTVTDNLCSFSKSQTLVMATSPVLNVTKQDASCNINNGQLNANINLGTGTSPFSYTWNGTPASSSLVNIDSGTYKVVVTDVNSCKDSTIIYVSRIPMLTVSLTGEKSKCGEANGSIATNVGGGASTKFYAWSNGASTANLSNILAGAYTLTLSDNGNCTITSNITIDDWKKPELYPQTVVLPVCGKPNGSIMTTTIFGTKPLRYLWNTGDTTTFLNNVADNTYTLVVTDSIGCKDTLMENLISGASPGFDSIRVDRSTCGLSNGGIYTLMSVRAINPVYTWSTGFVGNHIVNIGPGTYTLTVTDDRQCEIIRNFVVPTTKLPKIKLDSIQSFCLKANGSITSTVTEGTGSYQYLWNTGATSPNIAGLFPGIYRLTVTDSLNCRDSAKITVTEEPNLVTATYDTFNLICFQDFSGRVKFFPSGGQFPYSYKVYTTRQDSVAIGLSAGKHYFTITDNKGCEYKDSFTLTQPNKMITRVLDSINLICHNQPTGEILVKTTGGTFPYTYRWFPSGAYGDRAINLYAGTQTVAVEDLIGCKDTLKVTLTQPAPILITTSSKIQNPCYGTAKGSLSVNVVNGTKPYQYNWSNKANTKDLTNLKRGVYTLNLIDSNGCSAGHTDSLIDPARERNRGSIITKDLICKEIIEGEITVNAEGGVAPYQYSMDSGKFFSYKNKWTRLNAGNYYILIRDKENCETYKDTAIAPAPILRIEATPSSSTINLGESVSLGFNVLEGNNSWINEIMWSDGNGLSCSDCEQPIATTYVDNHYVLTIKYLSKCTLRDTVYIKVLDDNELYIPTAFSPLSANPENATFKLYSNKVVSARLTIFNRWSEKMYETEQGNTKGWDGYFKGELAPTGEYSYIAEVTYLNSRKVIKKGSFILVR
ncbi:MAG: choice-of-anchor L domain-containing protein [Chitinophagales bacterium]|nr:choice-of-anchor L domain-containing protein [Chitinophagales bacterium]